MDLVGDEKRIQALFSELSFEDQSSAPRFEELWKRARTVGPPPVHRSNKSAVMIAATLLVVAGCSFGAWSWYRATRSSNQKATSQEILTPPSTLHGSVVQESNTGQRVALGTKSPQKHRKNLARLRPTERVAIRDAALLSSWQSPTQTFLESPAGLALNTLPQLNESSEQLKEFLPKNSQPTKESNQ